MRPLAPEPTFPASMLRLRLFVAAALLPALGLPSPACAQVYLGLDATLTSPYLWRGMTRAGPFRVVLVARAGLAEVTWDRVGC